MRNRRLYYIAAIVTGLSRSISGADESSTSKILRINGDIDLSICDSRKISRRYESTNHH
jgi:hypothetical protein